MTAGVGPRTTSAVIFGVFVRLLLHCALEDCFHGLRPGHIDNQNGTLGDFHGMRRGHGDNLLFGALDDCFESLRHRRFLVRCCARPWECPAQRLQSI